MTSIFMRGNMPSLLILNDLHLGTQRGAGTTPASAAALKQFLFDQTRSILDQHKDKDVLINGDLFDKFSEEESTIEQTFQIFHNWLRKSGRKLHLAPGNHDFSAKADKLSSFHLLGSILTAAHPDQVTVYAPELSKVQHGVWVIPHCLNQDLFDMELEKALEIAGEIGRLFLHANVMNPFAEQADHSLNVSEEMARRFAETPIQLVFAHEHQRRCISFNGASISQKTSFDPSADIIVMGNQFPSSISDCLPHGKAQEDGRKFAHVLTEGGWEQVETWTNLDNFTRVDWRDFSTVEDEMFIRVEGTAEQSEAADVVTAIAKYRSASQAFIITNAVKIAGVSNIEGFDGISLEDIRKFDVREALLELFEPEERRVLEKCLED